ncbi:MAG: Bro-N domain-containing protein [Lentisphaerota bacterium]
MPNEDLTALSFGSFLFQSLFEKSILFWQIWFVAKDVADILEYTDTQAMTRRLDEEEVNTYTDNSSGQGRTVSIINESGLYNAILGSSKPTAKDFKKKVTNEILSEYPQTD